MTESDLPKRMQQEALKQYEGLTLAQAVRYQPGGMFLYPWGPDNQSVRVEGFFVPGPIADHVCGVLTHIASAIDLCNEMCACEEGRTCTACRIAAALEGREP